VITTLWAASPQHCYCYMGAMSAERVRKDCYSTWAFSVSRDPTQILLRQMAHRASFATLKGSPRVFCHVERLTLHFLSR